MKIRSKSNIAINDIRIAMKESYEINSYGAKIAAYHIAIDRLGAKLIFNPQTAYEIAVQNELAKAVRSVVPDFHTNKYHDWCRMKKYASDYHNSRIRKLKGPDLPGEISRIGTSIEASSENVVG